jgi:hypothetical protein
MQLVIDETAILESINNRVEFHGEDRVPAADIEIKINDIEAGELDQFALDDNMFSTTLWDKETQEDLVGGYKLGAPCLALLKSPLAIDMKIENHKVTINIETPDKQLKKVLCPIVINPAVIKKIKFTPKHHGLADVTLQVSGNLQGAEIGKIIDKYLGDRVSLKIEPAENAQSDLVQQSAGDQGSEAVTG